MDKVNLQICLLQKKKKKNPTLNKIPIDELWAGALHLFETQLNCEVLFRLLF